MEAKKSYDPTSVEKKWQQKWEESNAYRADLKGAKNPYYTHVMFPYPSGDKLHVGHWYNFGPADSFARFKRMNGYDVFSPMGFDAFGLPAENYAIKTGVHPSQSISANVETMIEQLKRIGTMYDWGQMVNTSTPEYYRWTQWLFLQMFKNDLAYQKDAPVNHCSSCQTVLANEQVKDGACERCGTMVVQKPLNQWYWKITKYAQRLLDGLGGLDWPEKTKIMQTNWIGRSDGAEVDFVIEDGNHIVTVFTTRPDTLFGATYMVLAPEHALVSVITSDDQRAEVEAYIVDCAKKTELERTDLSKVKTGVFTGALATNPVNGEQVPIWIADYVLAGYGTGAIMAVPGHDERDYEFAKQFDLPIREVVAGGNIDEAPHCAEGVAVNSDYLDGLKTPEAKEAIIKRLEKEKKGVGKTTYRLRDWLVSRQRYWGALIPIVYDPDGNVHPVPEEHLPWLIPTDVEFKPTGKSPIADSKELKERVEKIFGEGWTPEVDTMDTFVCSSFYSYMYLGTEGYGVKCEGRNAKCEMVDKEVEKKWMPVDMYIGGAEHACMHLIYTRFVGMVLKDLGHVSAGEPYKRLVHQGIVTSQGAKMSKSKGNAVSPDAFVEKYGSDVFRMYLMFMGPFTEGGDWNDSGIKGIDRFVKRIYGLVVEECGSSADILSILHRAIKKVGEDIEALQFNTAISTLMELLNALEKEESVSANTMRTFVQLLAPLAPHLAEELWETIGGEGFVIDAPWPEYDSARLVSDTFTLVVQVNGKLRASVEVASDISKDDALKIAREQENVQKYLEGADVKKEVYVPGKLVSFVI